MVCSSSSLRRAAASSDDVWRGVHSSALALARLRTACVKDSKSDSFFFTPSPARESSLLPSPGVWGGDIECSEFTGARSVHGTQQARCAPPPTAVDQSSTQLAPEQTARALRPPPGPGGEGGRAVAQFILAEARAQVSRGGALAPARPCRARARARAAAAAAQCAPADQALLAAAAGLCLAPRCCAPAWPRRALVLR